MSFKRTYGAALLSTIVISLAQTAARADDAENLAKKLSNPIASLISVPFQYNYDRNIGPVENGTQNYLKIQPVIPISLNADWNLISRTITPVMDQHDIFPGAGDQFGLNDTTESRFFSPKRPAGGWLIWGADPIVYLPTGTDKLGPTAVALTQSGRWTVGILANHIWSVGGDENGTDINSTFSTAVRIVHDQRCLDLLASTRSRRTTGSRTNGRSPATRRSPSCSQARRSADQHGSRCSILG